MQYKPDPKIGEKMAGYSSVNNDQRKYFKGKKVKTSMDGFQVQCGQHTRKGRINGTV